jgi:hypothetical protein
LEKEDQILKVFEANSIDLFGKPYVILTLDKRNYPKIRYQIYIYVVDGSESRYFNDSCLITLNHINHMPSQEFDLELVCNEAMDCAERLLREKLSAFYKENPALAEYKRESFQLCEIELADREITIKRLWIRNWVNEQLKRLEVETDNPYLKNILNSCLEIPYISRD